MARRAQAMVALLHQVDRQFVRRDTDSDGWIGDSAHQSRPSDHNPNKAGVVQAQDFDEDHGVNDQKVGRWLWRELAISRDKRIKYIIYEGQMISSYPTRNYPAWYPRPYSGDNKHLKHLHLSLQDAPSLYDDPSPWFVPVQEEDEMSITKLIRIAGSGTVYVCDGAVLKPVSNAKIAEAMWGANWRELVVDVKKDSVLASLPKSR